MYVCVCAYFSQASLKNFPHSKVIKISPSQIKTPHSKMAYLNWNNIESCEAKSQGSFQWLMPHSIPLIFCFMLPETKEGEIKLK